MAAPIRISKELWTEIEPLVSKIRDEYDRLREVFDNRSEKWHDESENAGPAEDWLDNFEQMCDAMDNLTQEPE